MIQVTNKYNCCGCSACVQACPKHCISFDEDEKGFRYPKVNQTLCIDCKLCEKVCLVLNVQESRKPLQVYAAINPNEEIRKRSSSGGIFSLLSESILKDGGVVFGARFNDNWEVVHDYTETIEGLDVFRKSKYVQSIIGETYKQAKQFLQKGRKVLFTGTPCQIVGLHNFLQKEYNNLLTVDVVCHGVPSPLVWRTYLQNVVKCPHGVIGKNTALYSLSVSITDINFRDKRNGWKRYSFAVQGKPAFIIEKNDGTEVLCETLDENLYMQIFLKDLCLRPSCTNCPAKSGKSYSDLTLADYWGISNHHPKWDDDKGTSLILVNSRKGDNIWKNLEIYFEQTSYEEALKGNPSIEKNVVETKFVSQFWHCFDESNFEKIPALLCKMKPSILRRMCGKIRRMI